MGSYIFCLLILLTTVYQPSFGLFDFTDVFEFGKNKGKVTFSTSGDIGLWPKDKVTVIPIKTPDCTKITYVRVEVHNVIGPPYVKFDDDISSVIIKYRKLQHSVSKYVILAKTKKAACEKGSKEKLRHVIYS